MTYILAGRYTSISANHKIWFTPEKRTSVSQAKSGDFKLVPLSRLSLADNSLSGTGSFLINFPFWSIVQPRTIKLF
jgi:hypothetical protein